jgi:carbonic anhydrase/acetyltransferase-like protein (isoleucine patch superfamily)
MPVILNYQNHQPRIDPNAYIAPNASIIGDVEIGEHSSIWFGAVLRGDVMPIRIGPRTSIQDNCVVHATNGWAPTVVGSDCTVGHAAVLHGCTLEDRVLVGMGAIVLDGAYIAADTLIAAGSVVIPECKFPPGMLLMGRPAKAQRALREDELAQLRLSSKRYVDYATEYMTSSTRL